MKQITIFTDGGCSPNPGIGGWAAILVFNEARKEISGGHPATTNNRAELTALLEALKLLKEPCSIDIVTDSEYVRMAVAAFSKRATKKKAKLKNLDLLEELHPLISIHSVRWTWVKGHAGHPENERCDELAGLAIQGIRNAKVFF